MSKSMLAFIRSETGIPWALNYAEEKEAQSLTIVSEDDLPVSEINKDFDVKVEKLANYRADDLDKLVLHEIKSFWERLFGENPRLRNSLLFCNNDLTQSITYPFGTVAQHWFRPALTIRRIVSLLRPDLVIADDYWMMSANLAGIVIHNRQDSKHKHLWAEKTYRKILFVYWMVIGLCYKLIFPVLLGKLLNWKKKEDLLSKRIYLIGSYYHNKAFYPIWNKITENNNDTAEIFFSDISSTIFRIVRSSRSKGIVEGLVDFKDLLSLMMRYVKILWFYYRIDIREPTSCFKQKTDRFFLLTLPGALLFTCVGKKLEHHPNIKRIIFSLPNSWQSTSLASFLGKQGKIETVSSTHGMVLDPLSYRSNHSLKITWGAFDAHNLSSYSDDYSFIYLDSVPGGLKKAYNKSPTNKFFRITPGNGKTAETMFTNQLNGNHACVLPSSNFKGKTLYNFLEQSVKYLSANKEKYNTDNIVVKIHPRSNFNQIDKFLEDIIKNNVTLPVFLSREADLTQLFKSSSFALCTPSSIMLDLLEFTVPFSVYTGEAMLDQKFILNMPSWMRFKSFGDLDSIKQVNLKSFHHTAHSLKKLYWGDKSTPGYDLDKITERLSR